MINDEIAFEVLLGAALAQLDQLQLIFERQLGDGFCFKLFCQLRLSLVIHGCLALTDFSFQLPLLVCVNLYGLLLLSYFIGTLRTSDCLKDVHAVVHSLCTLGPVLLYQFPAYANVPDQRRLTCHF